MRLLLDEDSQGKALVRLLTGAGHDVETVTQAGIAGSEDAVVLDYARRTDRVVITRNGRDFVVLHLADSRHPGVLVEYQDEDPAKNMTYAQILTAINKIESSGWDIRGEIAAINAWA